MLIKKSEYYRVMNDANNEELAEYYFSKGTFESVVISDINKKNEYQVQAVFRARYYKNNISLKIDEVGQASTIKCDCPFCNEQTACAHVGATLLYIMNLPNNTTLPYNEDIKRKLEIEQERHMQRMFRKSQISQDTLATRSLITEFQNKIDSDLRVIKQQDNVKIISEIHVDQSVYESDNVTFKIGIDKFYVIKNIGEFLLSIENKQVVKYGKSLTLKHDIELFDEDTLRQIEFMKKYLYHSKDNYVIKSIPLSFSFLDDYFELYSNLPYNLSRCIFETEMGFLDLNVEKIVEDEEFYYSIQINTLREHELKLGKKHAYQLSNERIVQYQYDDSGMCVSLLEMFSYRNELLMKQEELDEFYKYVVSEVEEFINTEEIHKYVNCSEVSNIMLYGDIDEDTRIRLLLNYEVNNQKYYGFNHSNQSLEVEKIKKVIEQYDSVFDVETGHAYLDAQNENTYSFVQDGLSIIRDWCEVFISDALVNLGKAKKIQMTVGLSIKHDLLDIELQSIDINKDEIMNVLQSYRRKKKFHRLTNGVLLSLQSNELKEIDEMLASLNVNTKDFNANHLELPAYRAFLMDDHVKKFVDVDVKKEVMFKDFIDNFKNHEKNKRVIPSHYFNLLRDYQKEGVNWLNKISDYGFGGILADDMGLGKTLQMITYLEMRNESKSQHIVVCPASLILNWQDEINKFNSSLKTLCIYGSANLRNERMKQIPEVNIVVTSYDYLRRDIEILKEYTFDTIILDEAQYIKNQKTKNAWAVKQLKAKHRFALTGTPIENSLAELWSIFDFLMPNYLYNYHFFQKNYEKLIVKEKDEEKQKQLKRLVEPFILRRNKEEVLAELPEKIENIYTINFNEEEKKLYLANLMQVNQELQVKLDIENVDKIKVLAMLTRLRQICCEPRMIYENIQELSSKLQGCMELIEALHYSKKKVLLFSSFTSALDLIEVELNKRKIKYHTITGKTDKMQRKERVNSFQNDDSTVFLISLKAGGTGLNLTAAQAVIHYDPWWNVSAQNQATDRAYRIGQERNVQVFKLIMKDSIEEKIQELQVKKKNLADAFVEGNTGSISSMSMDEIIELLKD